MPKNALPTVHPGEFLLETLEELNLSQSAFARAIGISPMRVSHVIKGTRPVTADLALRFGRFFSQSPRYWLNLQASYDVNVAEAKMGRTLRQVAVYQNHATPSALNAA